MFLKGGELSGMSRSHSLLAKRLTPDQLYDKVTGASQPLLEDSTPSTSLSTMLVTLTKIMSRTNFNVDADQPESISVFFVSVGVLACYSSVVYYPSALEAGKRYAERVPNSDWLFIYWGASAALLTNAVFNWALYCEMGHDQIYFFAWVMEGLSAWTESFDGFIRQFINFCTALGSVLPFWYISLADSPFWNILYGTSAAANLPVFFSGSDGFYEVIAYAEIQWLGIWLFACCYSPEDFKKNIECIKIKSLLVAHFLDLADDFRFASYEERVNFLQFFSKEKSDREKLAALLRVNSQDKQLPHYPNLIRESIILSSIKFIIGLFGMVQNFGHVIESYRAGAEYHWSLGLFFALCNIIPGIGFTIKGILGFGPLELLVEWCSSRKVNMSASYCAVAIFSVVARCCYAFSGLSGDELNYQSALYCGSSSAFAFFIGLAANIGTAFVFNGPQCEILLRRFLQPKPTSSEEERHSRFEAQLNEFVGISRTLPLSEVEALITNEKTKGPMLEFFKQKNFESSIVANMECTI